VLHKSEVGGVKLNLLDEASVRAAFEEITGATVGRVRIDGVIVSPMRRNELELLVSVIRDPTWGLMLTLGLGGIWVEVLKDVALVPLPVDRVRVIAALETLKAAPLLKGARGRPPLNLLLIADAIVAITRAAMAIGPDLCALEINPLAITHGRAEAMDALALWAD
jgi:succinyl-CoA synthetase beta subunit